MRIKENHLGVVLEKLHEDKIGGLSLDPMYDPTAHARVYGSVKYTPSNITHGWNMQPDFFQVGDRVYFHFDAAADLGTVRFKDEDGDTVFLIPLFEIYLRVREGKVVPRSGKCICEPYYGAEGCDVVFEDVDGKKVRTLKSKASGLTVKMNPSYHNRIAVFRDQGDPLSHEPAFDLKNGDMVYCEEGFNQLYNVEGEEVFVFDTEMLMGSYGA